MLSAACCPSGGRVRAALLVHGLRPVRRRSSSRGDDCFSSAATSSRISPGAGVTFQEIDYGNH